MRETWIDNAKGIAILLIIIGHTGLGLTGFVNMLWVFGVHLVMFFLLLWRLVIIASNTEDLFGSLLVVGVMAHIAIQVILNIAVVTSLIPNTGITLPFISYGGSAIVMQLAEIGIVMNVARRIRT